MKFDKETILVFVVCVGILLGWTPFCRYMGWIQDSPPNAAQEQVAGREAVNAPGKPADATADKATASGEKISAGEAVKSEKSATKVEKKLRNFPSQTISNDYMKLSFNPARGMLESVELKKYYNDTRTEKIKLDAGSKIDALAVTVKGEWKVKSILDNSRLGPGEYKLVRQLVGADGENLVMTQEWGIAGDYVTTYRVIIRNQGKKPVVLHDVSVISGGMQPFSVLAGDEIRRTSHRIDYMTVDGKFHDIAADDKSDDDFYAEAKGKILWAGVSNKYFTSIMFPNKPFDQLLRDRRRVESETVGEYYIAAVGGQYRQVAVKPGGEAAFKFKYYSGPKIISQLKSFDRSTAKIMHLAWGPLDWIARILLNVLIALKSLCGSYGWSIVILTLIVRLLFWPVTHKANSSMKKMQKLQPKIKDIREKYKSDPQIMNSKVMALYREEKVSPLGGCLPILLQIPVFIALYQTLDGAVELRQVPFLWAADLAKPDTIAHIMTLPINPLVIAMSGLMVLQQKLTPSAMDPMQQKMMMAMPIVMLFFLYSLPSGLTLYWTVSQLFSIVQLVIQQKFSKDDKAPQTQKK